MAEVVFSGHLSSDWFRLGIVPCLQSVVDNRRCHKTKTCSHPNSSRVSSPRQPILEIMPGIGFLRLRSGQALGNPPRWWTVVGCRLDESRAINELPCSLCPLVSDFRTVLYVSASVRLRRSTSSVESLTPKSHVEPPGLVLSGTHADTVLTVPKTSPVLGIAQWSAFAISP